MADNMWDRLWTGVPKRFRRPLGVTWAATVVAIALAVGPFIGGRYDGTLAVLTATLVTVIWYTYFTYRAVHREAETFLLTALKTSTTTPLLLMPVVRNPMARAVSVWTHVEVWVDGEPVDLGPFYRGEEARVLGAQQGFRGSLGLGPHVRSHVDKGNFQFDTKQMCARMHVRWTDAFGETGNTLPLHLWWSTPAHWPTVLVAPSDIAAHFNGLSALSAAGTSPTPATGA
jgi:hypothetical protein